MIIKFKNIDTNTIKFLRLFNKELYEHTENIKISLSIIKAINEMQDEIIHLFRLKDEIIEKYGERNEINKLILDENNQVKIQDKYIEIAKKEMEDLEEKEIKVSRKPFTIEWLDNINFRFKNLGILEALYRAGIIKE